MSFINVYCWGPWVGICQPHKQDGTLRTSSRCFEILTVQKGHDNKSTGAVECVIMGDVLRLEKRPGCPLFALESKETWKSYPQELGVRKKCALIKGDKVNAKHSQIVSCYIQEISKITLLSQYSHGKHVPHLVSNNQVAQKEINPEHLPPVPI